MLHSVARSDLQLLLVQTAAELPNVHLHFDHRFVAVDAEKGEVVPNFIEPSEFHRSSGLIIPESRAIFIGRLSDDKGIYEFIDNMTHEVLGHHSRTFFPFVLTLFTFILTCNVLGLIPYAFTVTSHIIVTLALALTVFIGATIVGFMRNGARYLKIFVPSGVPPLILIILVPIEIVSYFIRPFSLSIRLFANMMAGHMMLKVAAGFVIMLGIFAGWFPLIATVALYALELLVALLQAYVFALLTCLYLSDALHVDH